MGHAATSSKGEASSVDRQRRRNRWVMVIPLQQERRLYFVVTVVLAAWYLLDRLIR